MGSIASYSGGETLVRCENKRTPVAAQYTPTSILSDGKGLFSTGLLEGFPFSYKCNGVESNGLIEGSGFRFSCPLLDLPKIVSAIQSSKNAGGILNNIFLDSGVTIYTIVNRLKGTHLGSLDEAIKEVIHCPPNMEQFEKWKALFAPNGHVGIIASIADETSIEEQESGLVKEIDDITLKSAEDSPCCSNLTKLQRPDESFPNRCDLDNHFSSKKQRIKYDVDLVSDNEAQNNREVMRYGVNTEGRKKFSEIPNKNQQRKVEKITENSRIMNVRSLFSTGILEGLPVTYKKDKARIHGIISNLGYRCGCSSCNYNNVLSALEFEKHAGMTSKNQNNHIFLECGITIYQLVKFLKDRRIQLGSLHKVFMEFQIQPSMEHFKKWKGNSGSFSADINKKEIGKDADETEPNDLKIQITDNSVLQVLRSSGVPGASKSNSNQLKHKVTSQSGSKKRDNNLHRSIFNENGLQDGSKLSYRVKGKIIKTGRKEGNCIMCDCCHEKMSPSQFEAHAGFYKRRKPYRRIYTSDGISLHDLSSALFNDQNLIASSDNLCATCRTGGNLVCCDGCTKYFHPACLELQIVPGSECYCPHCMDLRFRPHATNDRSRLRLTTETDEFLCCTLCKDDSFILDVFGPKTIIFCTQCEREYHIGCLKDHGVCDLKEVPLDCTWFCSVECGSIHSSLRNLVDDGEKSFPNWLCSSLKTSGSDLTDVFEAGIYWQLLSGNYVSDKLKLDKTIEVFKEVYYPIVGGGNDFLTSMVYGEDAAGKLLGGVYCAIIAVKSVIISAAIFRVFGRSVAEIPLVATREKYRGNDCFRFLFSLVEQILSSLEVEYIIVPTTKDTLSLWTDKFGFSEIAEERLKTYLMEYPLMMFESTTILEKAIVREPIAPSQQEAMSTQEHAPKEAQLEGGSQLEEATLPKGGHVPKEMEIDEVCPIEQEETTSAEGDHVPKAIDTHEIYAMELILPSQQEATSASGGHATEQVEVDEVPPTLAKGEHVPKEMEIDEVCPIEQEETTSAEGDHVPKAIDTHKIYAMELILPSQQEFTSAAGGHATEQVEVDEVPPTLAKGEHVPKEMEIDEVCPIEQEETTSAEGDHVPKAIDAHEIYAVELILPSQQEATSASGGHATEEVEVDEVPPTLAKGEHVPKEMEIDEVCPIEEEETTSAEGDHVPKETDTPQVCAMELILPSQQEATSAAGGHATEEVEVQLAEQNQQDKATAAQGDLAFPEIEIHEVYTTDLIVPGQQETTSAAKRHAPEEIEVQVVYHPDEARVSRQHEATSTKGEHTYEEIEARQICQIEMESAMPNQDDAASAGGHAPEEMMAEELNPKDPVVPSQQKAMSAEEQKLVPILPNEQEATSAKIKAQQVYQRRKRVVPSQHESTSAEEVKHSTKEVEVDKVYQRHLRRKWRGASAPDS